MVSEDYYELLGVPRVADEAAIKAAYRRLAKECHPDRHNGCRDQEARFKAINEAYDVLKDPQKRAAYDRFGKAAFQNGGGGQDPFGSAGFEGFSDIFSTIFGEFMDPRGARQNAARGADLRYDLELSLEEAFTGIEKSITVEAMATCDACDGRGCTGLDRCTDRCRTCGGMGKVRAQQGFFVVERGCPNCRGSGEVVTNPCPGCQGEGRALTQRKLSVKIPAGVDEGTRIRVAGEGEAGVRSAASG
ncbi:MAG: DnaJ domain-containing protein, partial [Sphingomicrobium sp.]